MNDLGFGIVDGHLHIGGAPERKGTAEDILALMREQGIERAVAFPAPGLRPDNEALAEAIAPHRDRFAAFAWVNPHRGDEAAAELERMVRVHGFRGVKFQPVMHAFQPMWPMVHAIMRKAEELGIVALFHSGHAPYSLPWEIGEVAEGYPSVSVIMDHMGLQWMGYVDAAIRVAKRLPNVILGTTGMLFHGRIRQAVREIGPDRVVFGSDAPMVHPGPEILRIRVAGLTPEEERMVLRENMLRLITP
jgi:hypothetical protein